MRKNKKSKEEGTCSACGSKGEFIDLSGIPITIIHEMLLNKCVTRCPSCNAIVCFLCLMESKGSDDIPDDLKKIIGSSGLKVWRMFCPKCGSSVEI